MFKDVGKQIKAVALTLFWIQVILYGIAGVAVAAIGLSEEAGIALLFGVGIICVGIPLAWLGTVLIYGLGELIDKTSDTAKNTKQLLEIARKQELNKSATAQSSAFATPVPPAAPAVPAAQTVSAAPADEEIL